MTRLRSLVFGLLAACLAVPSASACFQWNPERTLFLNEVPGVDVAVVAKVTIMMVGESNISDEPIRYAVARVDEIIKGTIDRPLIWIGIRRAVGCKMVEPGDSGLVAGSLVRRAQGSLELIPLFSTPVPPRRKDT